MGAPWGPMGPHGAHGGAHGGPHGAPMGPMWPAGLPAGWKSSFHFSRCYFSQTETQNLARDLANGVSECILDPFSRLLQTILYRTDRRRAHHLPPDPNIFNGHNRFLLNWPFSGGSKILIFPRCYFWQTKSNRLFDRLLAPLGGWRAAGGRREAVRTLARKSEATGSSLPHTPKIATPRCGGKTK